MRARPTRPWFFVTLCWLALAAGCASNDLSGPQVQPDPADVGALPDTGGGGGGEVDTGAPGVDAGEDAGGDDAAMPPECTGDAQCPPGAYCDTAQLECVTDCANDDGCQAPLVCDVTRGRCIDAPETCGDGSCVAGDGEDCVTCAADCACEADQNCSDGMCIDKCGDSMCVAADGEDCDTCAADCACNAGSSCNAGACEPDCGDGFCDAQASEDCGTCAADCACDSAFKCVANSCIPRCGDGLCEASENCQACPQDCGCEAGQRCQDSMCVCDDACSNGETDCVGSAQRQCVADLNGCFDFGAPVNCPSGVCTNGSCCTPQCNNAECGADTCGGTCGTCTFACGADSNCTRRLTVNFVRTSCDDAPCQDTFGKPDPYIEVVVGNQTFDTGKGSDGNCDNDLVAVGWQVGGATQTFTKTQLQTVTIRVKDQDNLNNDDTCATWLNVDLTQGTTVLSTPGNTVQVSLTTTQ
jgi:hypothetical protein